MTVLHRFNLALRRILCGAVLTLFSFGAHAGFEEITAQFRPDPANPMLNRFTNTTPSSGYCENFHVFCKANNLFSLGLPMGPLPQTTGGPLQAKHANPREGVF
ncbi:hypothetical protein [Pseudomonas costantinii]|uniref:hypothetical protein n=1 Tax=Pseudomonas costantinii TaxID=168469 RepID=UPI002109C432|nr:hypothetical protein [Pseudomonas costantinii]